VAYKRSKKVIYQKIKDYIRTLQENGIEVWQVYLFGSYAKNRFTAESDIDLAIFLNKDNADTFSEDLKLMRLRRKVDLRIEPHSFSISDFNDPDPFVQEVFLLLQALPLSRCIYIENNQQVC
jgi:predicted nucleotidyltransferase